MKRKGFIFMEVLLALLLLSALAAAVFPILGQTAGAMAFMDRRRRAVNEAVFAADFMIEKIRNNLRESAAQMSGNVYRYEAYIWVKDGKDKGLVNVSFRMESRNPKETYAVKTAILPYRDFYGVQ